MTSSVEGSFMNRIDGFIDYFAQVPEEEKYEIISKESAYRGGSMNKSGKKNTLIGLSGNSNKDNDKENDGLRNELEKCQIKIKKLSSANKTLMSELNKYKIKEEEKKSVKQKFSFIKSLK